MTAPEIILHAKQILQKTMLDMDALLALYNSKEVMTMDLLMTRKEAAEFIGRHEHSIDRLCREGKIRKEYDEHGQARIRKSELLRFKGVVFDEPHEDESELERLLRRFGKSNNTTKRYATEKITARC